MAGLSNYQDIKDQVYKTLSTITGIKKGQIQEDTPWYELDAESYELVEFIVALKDTYNIQITTKDLIKMKNLKDIVDFLYIKSREEHVG